MLHPSWDHLRRTETRLIRQLEQRRAQVAFSETKVAAVEAKITELLQKAGGPDALISNLLEDVRVNLEAINEPKTMIDHASEKLARIDFTMQEVQTAVQTLKQERELAERLENSIKQLRLKTAKTETPRKSATA